MYPGDVTGYTRDGRSVVIVADTMRIRFTFYAADVVRADFFPSPSTLLDSSLVVVRDSATAVVPDIQDQDSLLVISSSAVTVQCTKHPLRLRYHDNAGRLLLADDRDGGFAANFEERSVSFAIQTEERYYGTGERGTPIERRGQAFDSRNTQIGGYSTPLATMNLNVPFIASSRGYALYFENTYPARFDVGATNPVQFSYLASGGELSYFLIAAPDVPSQLERYTWLTGRQPLPPRWAFGFIQSKYGYTSDADARQTMTTMRQKQIPCDAIVLDLYWFNQMGDISWKLSSWPDPFGMMRDFLNEGIKTIVITEPYIVQPSLNFSTAVTNGYLARNAGGNPYILGGWWSCGCNAGLLDITNPAAASWWWSKHPAFFGNELAGIWTDLGEPERDDPAMQFYAGPAAKVHNVYNLLWAETLFKGYSSFRPNQRIFNLTRSGYAGSQRFGVIPWSGDVSRSFGGLAVQLPMVLSMGMSGFAYHNSDIGGFTGGSGSPELYVRWFQYGTFCPITRAHGAGGNGTEPWVYGSTAEAIVKKYVETRYRLIPYIYTLAHENTATGMPLVRPLFFHDASPALAMESSTYMLGEAFLVSPVVAEGQTQKNVVFPAGTWFDYWTDRPFSGGRTTAVSAPLETLPLFVKAGSIIPMQSLMQYSDERPVDTLFLAIYPPIDGPGHFTLYEDDGKTLSYQSGAFAHTLFASRLIASGADTRMEVTINPRQGAYDSMPPVRTYVAELHGIAGRPSSVTVNGRPLATASSYNSMRSGSSSFWYDSVGARLSVQITGMADSTATIAVEQVQVTGVAEGGVQHSYGLMQNYPNPWNPTTEIAYTVDSKAVHGSGFMVHGTEVKLVVYDLLGREVATLVDEKQTPGRYTVRFDAGKLASGVYLYRLQAGGYVETRRMVLLK